MWRSPCLDRSCMGLACSHCPHRSVPSPRAASTDTALRCRKSRDLGQSRSPGQILGHCLPRSPLGRRRQTVMPTQPARPPTAQHNTAATIVLVAARLAARVPLKFMLSPRMELLIRRLCVAFGGGAVTAGSGRRRTGHNPMNSCKSGVVSKKVSPRSVTEDGPQRSRDDPPCPRRRRRVEVHQRQPPRATSTHRSAPCEHFALTAVACR